jgi:glycosyltransferase involved in cell wall biosynthesis
MKSPRIAVVVQGRFHAFDLAKALDRIGAAVTLYTNYPRWAMRRFGVPPEMVRSCWPHGVAVRTFDYLPVPRRWSEPLLHRWFGGWAARQVIAQQYDAVYIFSGVAEELLSRRPAPLPDTPRRPVVVLMRSAAHISVQARLLREEEQRAGVAVDRPSAWMIAREEREYEQADWIGCPSSFVRSSFTGQGVAPARLFLLPLSVDVKRYRPEAQVNQARQERIRSGQPLRVITLGNVSMQKGFVDYVQLVERMAGSACVFRVVGHRLPEVRPMARRLNGLVEFVDRVPFDQVPQQLNWADLFLFPTVQDGFPGVLVQAGAAGVPILTTVNSSGPDVVEDGRTGWVVPVRDPQAMAEKLQWALSHREEFAWMANETYQGFQRRSWDDVARDLVRQVTERQPG